MIGCGVISLEVFIILSINVVDMMSGLLDASSVVRLDVCIVTNGCDWFTSEYRPALLLIKACDWLDASSDVNGKALESLIGTDMDGAISMVLAVEK